MPIAGGQCPNCGAPIEFRSGSSLTKVCGHCGQFVVRTDRALEPLGKISDLAATEHSLALADRGTLGGRGFEVLGRVVLRHPMGGSWEEYHLRYDDGSWSWVNTAQGRWAEVTLTREVWVRPYNAVRVGEPVRLGSYGDFVVSEASSGVFESAAGELPFVARIGQHLGFIDLSGPHGSLASVHYVEEGGRHQVFVGRAIERADLHLEARVGVAPVQAVPMTSIRCNNCGGDLPARVDPGALHVVCPYCKAISDHATHAVVARQDVAHMTPKIPLGSRGNFSGVEWTVIGYLERSTSIEGERFRWSEYLLYNPGGGYRWVIEDEGVWRMATPVPSGSVDTSRMPQCVLYNSREYLMRNQGIAVVDRVLGEFYWRVTVGEQVQTRDFVWGRFVLSCEETATERNWTLGEPITPTALFHALGLPTPVVETAWKSSMTSSDVLDGDSTGGASWVVILLGICGFILLMVLLGDCGSNDDDDSPGSGGGHGSSWGLGGLGGK